MSHPDQPSATLGPEDDTRGMAYGGTTTHIDFVYVRPGVDSIQSRHRAARGALEGQLVRRLRLPRHAVRQPRSEGLRADSRGDPRGLSELQGLHHQRAAAASQAAGQSPRLRADRLSPWRRSRRPAGLMVVHGEDEDLVQFNYERFRAEGRMDGTNLHLVHTKLSELLAFRRTVALARAMSAAVYFVHTSAKEGVDTIGEARAERPARLRRDAAPVRVLQRRVLQDAARVLLAHLSVAQVPRGPGGALARARARRPGHAGHRRVPDERSS